MKPTCPACTEALNETEEAESERKENVRWAGPAVNGRLGQLISVSKNLENSTEMLRQPTG
jgi:hypothetical protein